MSGRDRTCPPNANHSKCKRPGCERPYRTMALAGGIVVTMMILAVVLAVVVSDGEKEQAAVLSATVPVLVGIAAPAVAALFAAAGVQRNRDSIQRIAGHVDTIRQQLADELDEIHTRPIPTQQPTAGRHTWNDGGAQ